MSVGDSVDVVPLDQRRLDPIIGRVRMIDLLAAAAEIRERVTAGAS
jgi:hypothetical protein